MPQCREGADEAGRTQSDALDYNHAHGWRGGPPPRQNKNWIPRIALAEAIALALLIASGYAAGGYLRVPTLPLASSGGATGIVYNRSLAIAWTINDVIAGAFHSSGIFRSAPVATENTNRHGNASGVRSSSSGSHSWTSSWLTSNQGTPSRGNGISPFFRALADILSMHNSSKTPLAIGSSSGNGRGIGSGAGSGHAIGASAVLGTPSAGTEIASANTHSAATTANAAGLASAALTSTDVDGSTGASMAAITSVTGASGAAPIDAQRVWANPTTGSGYWTTGTNWGGTAPGVGDVAAFTSAFGGADKQPIVDAAVSNSGVYFKNTGTSGWNITPLAASDTLTLTASGTTIGTETGDTTAVAIGAENTSGTNTIAASITLAPSSGSTSTIRQETGGTLVLSGAVSGTGIKLTKIGPGTLTLSGANTFSGGLTLSAGTLNIDSTTALGATAGTFTISAGTINNTSGGAITLANNNPQTWNSNFTFTGTNSLNMGTGAISLGTAAGTTRTITVNANTLTEGGVISNGTTANGLIKAGAGTLTLSGANTYTGTTSVSAGILNIQNNNALGTTAGGTTVSSGATLQLQGGITVGAEALTLSGTGASGQTGALVNVSGTNIWGGTIALGAAATISSNSGKLTVNGAINDNGHTLTVGGTGNTVLNGVITSSAGGLTKTGSGTLTLTGDNPYKGVTTVNGGTLFVNGNQTGKGAITVTNSGSTLAGTGSLAGDVTLNSGTNIKPGTGGHTTGILGVGALTMTSTSTYYVDIHGTTAGPGTGCNGYDQIEIITGGVSLSNATLTVHVADTLTVGDTFEIINHTTGGVINGIFDNLAEGATVTADNGDTFRITYKGGDGNDVVLTDLTSNVAVCPEPSTWIGGALAVAALAYTQRRRLARLLKRAAA